MNEAKMRWIEQQALMRYRKQEQARREEAEAAPAKKAEKLHVRGSVINAYDRLAAERIIRHSDFLPIAYLETGVTASRAVCRIIIMNGKGEIQGYGTGFLISPSLIMTNNHVLETPGDALYAVAEFNFEDDVNFQPRETISFRLQPDRLFVTDEQLDFTIVAAQQTASNGMQLADFGYLPLLFPAGKVLEGEYVSIIQHPKGGPKVVTLRENEVVFLSSDFIHYVSDTEPGSSGSPVFNDQWVVVGLHHAGVPDSEKPGEWIANEGIRISSILRFLQNQVDPHPLLEQLLAVAAIPEAAPMEVGTLDDDWYEGISGYDPAFLGEAHEVPLPSVAAEMEEDIARTEDGQDVLNYAHFSILMSKSRRLAFYTAVNIDGNQLVHVKRGNDKWYFDPRISKEYQSGPDLYSRNDLDRGHLTRRQDPNWGIDAVKANAHTFHFTNCAPQHKNLNQKTWLKLEDYILRNADIHDLKATVFTGPVFREDDMVYRGEFRIPAEFWKVAVIVKRDGMLSATAYLQTQRNLLSELEFAYGEFRTYQVPVAEIADLTGLDFGDLLNFDPLAALESVSIKQIENLGDVRL